MPDCSLLSRALIQSQQLESAVMQLRRWAADRAELIAPYHLQIEFSATLRGLERRGRISMNDANATWRTFESLDITYNWDDAWVRRAMDIARAIGASRTYDSLYLACAESVGGTLYTCDGAFARAVEPVSPSVMLVD